MGQGLPKAVTSVAVKSLGRNTRQSGHFETSLLLLIKASMSVYPTSSHLANVHFWSVLTLTCYFLPIELSCEPSPLMIRRVDGTAFRVGFADVNGWRPSMEDAHVIYAQDTWGFFGVFDGHGGDQCSCFIARRISEELAQSGMPEDDAAVTALALSLDKEFLDSNQPVTSPELLCHTKVPVKSLVKAPSTPGGSLAGFSKAWLHASETGSRSAQHR